MKPLRLLALLAAFLLLRPVVPPTAAQDGDGCGDGDGGTEIEIGGDDEPDSGAKGSDEEDDVQRKKNSGLAGQGGSDDDPNAPKVKMSLQEQINAAIKKGTEWLKQRHDGNGNWGPVEANRHYGEAEASGKYFRDELGPTAWAVYTLAKCGVKRTDPAIKKGMAYIFGQTEFLFDVMGGDPKHDGTALQTPSRANPRVLTTYESAAIVMMIEAVYEHSAKLTGKHKDRRLYSDNPLKLPPRSKIPKDTWKYMHDRVIHLTVGRRGGGKKGRTIAGTQVPSGDNKGGWRYGQGTHGDADLSATQFVLLALRAASQAGYPVEKVAPNVWLDAAGYVRNCQRASGGFSYQRNDPKETGSMAACGVGCLVICKEQIELGGQTAPPWIDEAIKKGTEWLDQNFRADRNPNGQHHYYYLYGIERVGDLTGRKEFAGKDWYVRGAQLLVAQQDATGAWTDGTEAFPPRDVISTCLALLFLKRATPPTVTLSEG